MKRIIAAALLASLSVPAFAQTQGASSGTQQVAGPASAASGASAARAEENPTGSDEFTLATGPWARDWSFIAPAQ